MRERRQRRLLEGSAVILQTNSLILTQTIKDNSYRLAMVGGAILELKNFIIDNFSVCEIIFCP